MRTDKVDKSNKLLVDISNLDIGYNKQTILSDINLQIPQGECWAIIGPSGSGKTTLSLHVAAEAQKAGGVAAFIDAEHALDPIYARALGVDVDELLVSQPDTGEQALEIAEIGRAHV